VPHRGSLVRFSENDSRTLEAAYQAHRDEIEAAWWEQEAERHRPIPAAKTKAKEKQQHHHQEEEEEQMAACTTAPELTTAGTAVADGMSATSAKNTLPTEATAASAPDGAPSWLDFMHPEGIGEEVGIPVRAGKFEVDMRNRLLRPCYWPAPRHRVVRGLWFAEKANEEWVPLRETLAAKLEQAHASCAWLPNSGVDHEVQPDGRSAAVLDVSNVPAVATSLPSSPSTVPTHAVFHSSEEAYLVMKDNTISSWLRNPKRLRLRRGYVSPTAPALLSKEAEVDAESEYDAAAVTRPTHLVLAVHGIGQTLERANIAVDAELLLSCIRQVERSLHGPGDKPSTTTTSSGANAVATGGTAVADANIAPAQAKEVDGETPAMAATTLAQQTETQRVEVLPVQWRRTMSLQMDALAIALMPPGIPALRSVLHSTAVEVLHYLTPAHRAAMLSSLVTSINSVYARFRLRNPDFSGPVSIFAHSLGSILCWDVLCNQNIYGTVPPPAHIPRTQNTWSTAATTTAGAPAAASAGPSSSTTYSAFGTVPVILPPLHFSVEAFILVGSPLGCFLALRGVDISFERGLGSSTSASLMQLHPENKGTGDGLPAARRVFNLYHPFDPVAYRIEPLAFPADVLQNRRAVSVPLFSGGKRLHVAAQEFGDVVSATAGRFWSFNKRSASQRKKKEEEDPKPAPVPPPPPPPSEAEAAVTTAGVEQHSTVDTLAEGVVDGAPTGGGMAASSRSLALAQNEGTPIVFGDIDAQASVEADQKLENQDDDTTDDERCRYSVVRRIAGGKLPSSVGWQRSDAGRLDFVLQEGYVENQYLSSLHAHFSYWSSLDVALLVHRAATGKDVVSGEHVPRSR
jgi:hypothetical protein